jgi:hypothetical protein
MKTLIRIAVLLVIASLSGCAGSSTAVPASGGSTRQDVFQVVQAAQTAPGATTLLVEFPLKAYKARIFNTFIKHSDPPYTVILSIDGQSVELTDEPHLEFLPGSSNENPEAGTGWRYIFRTTLQLQPGNHQVVISVPLAEVRMEKQLTIVNGRNDLKIQPVYNSSISRHPAYTGFDHGLNSLLLRLNDQVQ